MNSGETARLRRTNVYTLYDIQIYLRILPRSAAKRSGFRPVPRYPCYDALMCRNARHGRAGTDPIGALAGSTSDSNLHPLRPLDVFD